MAVLLRAPCAVGDALDRLTILAIKLARVPDAAARAHVRAEHDALRAVWAEAGLPDPEQVPEQAELVAVNTALWEVEDRLRHAEARRAFDDAFVADARAVYTLNDRRAALKRAVNTRLDSAIREEKAHPRYGADDAR